MLASLKSGFGTLVAIAVVALYAGAASAQSVPGSAGAKKASKCQQVVGKANGKFLGARLKRLAACSNAVLGCVQTASGDPKCLGKAAAKCRKAVGDTSDFDAAVEAAVRKACDALPAADLLDPAVLGFANAAAACGEVGVPALANAADVARCLRLLHARTSEQAFGVEMPRATELLVQAGVGGESLPLFGGCGTCAVDPPNGKPVTACGAAIAKASAAFVASTRTTLDRCGAAFVKCAQEKPADAGCPTKAAGTCGKVPAGLAKARTKLATAIQKKCGAVGFGTLAQQSGINLAALTCACQQVGVEPVVGVEDYATCVARQHECELATLLPTVVPGLDALLAAQGIAVSDLLCEPASPPAPAPATAAGTTSRSAPRTFEPPYGGMPRTFESPFGGMPRIFKPPFGGIMKFMKNVFPASLKSSRSPFSTRGTSPRVGFPTSGKCAPSAGGSCTFRLPISKKPTTQKSAGRLAADPPVMIIGVRRPDGEFVDDHFELPLGDTTTDGEVEITVDYADDLASCEFELALTVMEDGEVASYTAIEQQPHVPPANDTCGTAKAIDANPYFEVLDVTAADTFDGVQPSCTGSGFSRDVWYSFTPDASGILAISTIGSSYDTLIAVHDGCGGAEQGCANATDQDTLQVPVAAGIPYIIEIGNNGDPMPPTATLQLSMVFVPGVFGSPATISQLLLGTPVVSSPLCDFNVLGTEFPITFTYADPTGNVSGFRFPRAFEHFEPSQREEFGIPTDTVPVVTGDGFNGTVSFGVCAFFDTDTVVSFKVDLVTLGGLSNQLVGALPKPPGAN